MTRLAGNKGTTSAAEGDWGLGAALLASAPNTCPSPSMCATLRIYPEAVTGDGPPSAGPAVSPRCSHDGRSRSRQVLDDDGPVCTVYLLRAMAAYQHLSDRQVCTVGLDDRWWCHCSRKPEQEPPHVTAACSCVSCRPSSVSCFSVRSGRAFSFSLLTTCIFLCNDCV